MAATLAKEVYEEVADGGGEGFRCVGILPSSGWEKFVLLDECEEGHDGDGCAQLLGGGAYSRVWTRPSWRFFSGSLA